TGRVLMDRVMQAAADSSGAPATSSPGRPAPPILEFRGITKVFPGQRAVDDVSFTIEPGEVHALVGEHGAGQTTLIKVLAGGYEPDAGELLINGEPVDFSHPSQATAAGIACIHQDPNVQPALSVAENLTIGVSFERGRLGLIDWRAQRRMARRVL